MGVGTEVYALAIGPLVQLLLPWFMVPAALPAPGVSGSETGEPLAGEPAVAAGS